MEVPELLQQVGLTQYEAEAYLALLREGPLTGYELGKRSRVPLPRSYDVLERLSRRGLALVQPGDPPRYLAEDPQRYLANLRESMTARLEELAAGLEGIAAAEAVEGFWVLRGRDQIRDRIAAMIRAAEQTMRLHVPRVLLEELDGALATAGERGCRVLAMESVVRLAGDTVLVLADDREVVAGTLVGERSQAVVTGNRALADMARACFVAGDARRAVARAWTAEETAGDWLAWENDKQRRLRLVVGGSDVA